MKKLILFLTIILISGCSNNNEKVCFESKCFKVEVADNSLERVQGLMFRDYMYEDSGMLFVFDEEGKHSFWMKNTKIPLDIIWIGETMEVVDIYKNTQPCVVANCPSYSPDFPALYVLEINANLTDKYGINVGDKVKIN